MHQFINKILWMPSAAASRTLWAPDSSPHHPWVKALVKSHSQLTIHGSKRWSNLTRNSPSMGPSAGQISPATHNRRVKALVKSHLQFIHPRIDLRRPAPPESRLVTPVLPLPRVHFWSETCHGECVVCATATDPVWSTSACAQHALPVPRAVAISLRGVGFGGLSENFQDL
jgi:hypothetical protein